MRLRATRTGPRRARGRRTARAAGRIGTVDRVPHAAVFESARARNEAARDLRHRDRHASARAGCRASCWRAAATISRWGSPPLRSCARAGPTFAARADRRCRWPFRRGVAVEEFAGPHPAGAPGTHIHRLDPVDHHRIVVARRLSGRRSRSGASSTTRPPRRRARRRARRARRRPSAARCARALGASIDDAHPRRARAGRAARSSRARCSTVARHGRSATASSAAITCRSPRCPKAASASSSAGSRPARDKFSLWRVVLGALAPRRRAAR